MRLSIVRNATISIKSKATRLLRFIMVPRRFRGKTERHGYYILTLEKFSGNSRRTRNYDLFSISRTNRHRVRNESSWRQRRPFIKQLCFRTNNRADIIRRVVNASIFVTRFVLSFVPVPNTQHYVISYLMKLQRSRVVLVPINTGAVTVEY